MCTIKNALVIAFVSLAVLLSRLGVGNSRDNYLWATELDFPSLWMLRTQGHGHYPENRNAFVMFSP